MSHPSALSFETPLRELPVSQKQRQSPKRKALHINLQSIPAQDFLSDHAHTDLHTFAGNAQHSLSYPSEWIPPPASLATMDFEGIDLNDEIFFSHNPIPSYTTSSIDQFTLLNDTVAASSSSSSTANLNKSYASLNQHELATSPLKHGHETDLNSQFKHKHKHKHKRRFSLAAEQLSKMTLKTQSASKPPSPDMYNTLAEPRLRVEEPTVDPKHLFGSMEVDPSTIGSTSTVNMGKNGSEGVFVRGTSQNLANSNSIPASASASASAVDSQISSRYILPSSVSSPSLTTFFAKQNLVPEYSDVTSALELDYMAAMSSTDTDVVNARRVWSSSKDHLLTSALNNPSNPYVMNDECVSAITYWLNNTSNVISDKPSARHTSGVSKPGWVRRNSIPVVSQRADESLAKNARTLSHEQKRRRRKSSNNSSISERPLPASLSLHLKEDHVQATDIGEQSQASAIPPIHTITLPSSLKNENENETLLGDDGDRVYLPNTEFTQVLDGDLLRTSIDPTTINESASAAQYSALQLSSLSGAAEFDEEPKPFPCPDCEKQFKRSEHLKRHIRSVHSNIRPFHCKYCEKKFSRSDNLAQHMKTHFKVDANGTTSIIYGNPNPQNRGGRKKSVTDVELDEPPREEDMI